MKSSFVALASSVFVAFASAWTTPVGDQPQGNPISKPGLGELVPAGQPYTITWEPTSAPNTVTLLFLKGPSTNVIPQYAIAENIPNTGSYTWTPPADTAPGTTGYGIQLIDDDTGFYQYTTQFGISNDQPSSSSSSVTSTSSSSSSASSSTSSVPTISISSPYLSSSTSDSYSIEEATTVIHTNIVTITSCAPTVTNCPARSPTSAPAVVTYPVANSTSPLTYWSNSTMATATSTKIGIASTGFGTSATSSTATPSQFTGAGEKIRVGCAMGAVLVAAFALAL